MTYFYDYFAKEYRESRKDKLTPAPVVPFQDIKLEDVRSCRKMLQNAFIGYRAGRNAEVLKRLLGDYREYVVGHHDGHAKDRYNAFVYRYMVEAQVGAGAIGRKLGVTKETVYNYLTKALDEMLILCIGIPAADRIPEDKENYTGWLIENGRLFRRMVGVYVLSLFPEHEKMVERSRQRTGDILEQLTAAVEAYSEYCNDEHTRINTDIRKADILAKCIAGVSPAAIAKEYGCCVSTVYADIRENSRRLAAMLFEFA